MEVPLNPFSRRLEKVLGHVSGINLADLDPTTRLDIAKHVGRLSYRFTRERKLEIGNYLEDSATALAYLAYFFPVNAAKVYRLLDELAPTFADIDSNPIRVLDLGCGPGTGAMAVLDWVQSKGWFQSGRVQCVAVDQSSASLTACQRLWSAYCGAEGNSSHTLLPFRENLQEGLSRQIKHAGGATGYDLIIIQNVLSELATGKLSGEEVRTRLITIALDILSDHGTVMVIEPALRDASRQLHEVRDRLLRERKCTVYSPCLHERSCPALVNPNDWCHEERAWSPPTWIKAIDRDVGFIKDALKFSYLLLRKDGRSIVPRAPDLYRVVSELRVFKGEKRAWLCNENGRPEAGRLDRKRSPSNAAFDDWHRGAIVRISEIVRKERNGKLSTVGRIESDTAAQIIRSV
ncbi:MAG: small ribosomal subunit Rsm22 family protein [Nitrospiraceae bacterium]